MKIYITAQAQFIRDIQVDLINHVDQIEENFLKLLIAPKALTRNHWQGEIASQINRIRKSKGKSKIPKADDIFKWIYTEQLPELTDKRRFKRMVDDICDIENFDCPGDIDNLQNQHIQKLKQYYKWLASELSIDGYVERRKIFNMLDELL